MVALNTDFEQFYHNQKQSISFGWDSTYYNLQVYILNLDKIENYTNWKTGFKLSRILHMRNSCFKKAYVSITNHSTNLLHSNETILPCTVR